MSLTTLVSPYTAPFTITDEPMHEGLQADQLVRIFGPEVFEKTKENGYPIDRNEPAVRNFPNPENLLV